MKLKRKSENMINIENILIEIFLKRADINFQDNYQLKKENLFGSKINIPVRELVLALFDVQEKFSISISSEILLSGKFNTFNNINNIVSVAINDKESC
ncbi:peptide maturation system acyl carrier-related protein [Clostridium tagluense]|uniref:peptide maturation system acyl carrier-related protein n=1 Tax=Clostridium tagluense TaxID=360422 RepID=UPI001C6F5451|nr:peptide maturation system acyl carrier-related protein [Clostridium tagluense]MBW9159136.1 peptide maturation system acyl carrier-related protein [Clostridium tagluense]WLC68214.1 peptide maturation system acyl carrier-related protein [Clostridium tagluense]